jgi:hypothetical protein
VRGISFSECAHVPAEFGKTQPNRHLAAQNAAFGGSDPTSTAFARDHKNELRTIFLRTPDEPQKYGMRLALRLAMQIDMTIDRLPATREALSVAAHQG